MSFEVDHRTWNHHACQAAAATESTAFDVCHRIRNLYARQRHTISEGIFSDFRHRVRDNRILATINQRVGCCFYYRIAIASTVVHFIFLVNTEARQLAAIEKCLGFNNLHRAWNRHAQQPAASTEGRWSDARHRLSDSHSFQAFTATKDAF